MVRENPAVRAGLNSGWLAASAGRANRGQLGAALLALCAVFNTLDLITTSIALARGFTEEYPPSLIIMEATGPFGYSLAKIGFSFLLLGGAWFMWRRLDRLSPRESFLVLTLCLLVLAVTVCPVVNNVAALWQAYV